MPLPLAVARGRSSPVGTLAEAPATAPLAPAPDFRVSSLVSASSGVELFLSKVSLSVVTLSRSRTALTWVTALPGPRVAASIESMRDWRLVS